MTSNLLSWGAYPRLQQVGHECRWRADIPSLLESIVSEHGSSLAFGNGRSYGDSCLAASNHVLHLRSLDKFIAADWTAGVLIAEAGVSLQEVLNVAIPHGWFLAVTPGTKFVTLGGAVANDVHGKNHHIQGTFGRHVRRLGLVRSDLGRLICSPDANTEFFAATIGGLGLTGVIEWVEIQLVRIASSRVETVMQRFGNLNEFFALSSELDRCNDYCVAWVDCTAKGKEVGRGVYIGGNFATEGGWKVETQRRATVPVTPPFSLVNSVTLRAFNEVYWRKHPKLRTKVSVGYEPFFYPLDGILHWNRIYGRSGFQQYQCLIPEESAETAMQYLLSAVAQCGTGSFLAVIKRCGGLASPGLLSFPKAGTTLALDFPHNSELENTVFARLDSIVREAGGRLYPAKDAHMSPTDFQQGYPAWRELEALRDPVLLSHFWRRVSS